MPEMTAADIKHLKSVYYHMKSRCNNPHDNRYNLYGARGIKICDEWDKFNKFYRWAIENGYKSGLTIDRKDCNKGYCPQNCHWATMTFQQNNKRNNRKIAYNGMTLSLNQWSRKTMLGHSTLRDRLRRGWSVERALSTPCKTQYWHKDGKGDEDAE